MTFEPGEFSDHAARRAREIEGVRLAGFIRRAVAWWLDLLVVALVVTALGLPSALQNRGPHGTVIVPFDPFHNAIGALLFVLYFGLGTYLGRGQTLGKRLLRIRVVSLTRDRLSLWQSLERALGYAASALEAGFGFLQYFTHPNRQTVHDRIAETVVVAEPSGSRESRDASAHVAPADAGARPHHPFRR
ncbi:MAG: RDD family protein [Thermoanaerobaculia bacterium]